MDERKEAARMYELAKMYALGELTYSEYRQRRNDIIDCCAGLLDEIPEYDAPTRASENKVERLVGEATALRAAPIQIASSKQTKHRTLGSLIVLLAIAISGYAIYIASQ